MDRATWPLGLYCERSSLAFWAEPLNAWSNLAFLVAAFLAWRLWRSAGARDWPSLLLILVTAAIAFGSFAFHTAPSATTVLLDVVPIQIFVLGAIFVACRRYFGHSALVAGVIVAAFFFGAAVAIERIGSTALRGGIGYLPPLLAMPAIAAALWRSAGPPAWEAPLAASRRILLATLVFALSLTMRTLDQPLCPVIPTGLHFLWHFLNAVVLYLLLSAQIRFAQPLRA
jgi:hypothetical protein